MQNATINRVTIICPELKNPTFIVGEYVPQSIKSPEIAGDALMGATTVQAIVPIIFSPGAPASIQIILSNKKILDFHGMPFYISAALPLIATPAKGI